MPTETWRKTLQPSDTTLQQSIHCLDESSLQIVLVTAADASPLGTPKDGDIHRVLLRHLPLAHGQFLRRRGEGIEALPN